MNTPAPTPPKDATVVRTLGKEGLTPEEAREHNSYETHEIPTDILEDHTTKAFTPHRYALICRDIAYFTRSVGDAPIKRMGDSPADPGSGMRRSREGALYGLAKRTAILKHAVDANLINITNTDGFDAPEHEYRFEITDRGKWCLKNYFGSHTPVHKLTHKQISRSSSALNHIKTVIDTAESGEASTIRSYEDFQEQVGDNDPLSDPDSGTYHINPDHQINEFPQTDPANVVTKIWIRQRDVPAQFDVTTIDRKVHLCVDLSEYIADTVVSPNTVEIRLGNDGDLYIMPTGTRSDITITESSQNRIGIKGEYDPFVTSGAKTALTETTDANWNDDYKTWYLKAEEDGLKGITAILETNAINRITTTARIVHDFTKHI